MPDETTVTTLRLPKTLYERVIDLAIDNRRSINNQLVTLIEAALPPPTPTPHKRKASRPLRTPDERKAK